MIPVIQQLSYSDFPKDRIRKCNSHQITQLTMSTMALAGLPAGHDNNTARMLSWQFMKVSEIKVLYH
jgi:hypothetical protein